MKRFILTLCLFCVTSALNSFPAEKPPVDPAQFAGPDGKLGEAELTLFVISRDGLKPDLKAITLPDGRLNTNAVHPDGTFKPEFLQKNLQDKAAKAVGQILEHLAPGDRFSVNEVRKEQKLIVNPDGTLQVQKTEPHTLRGIFGEPKILTNSVRTNGFLGPFLLRKTADDWSSDLSKAEGAKLSYSDDRGSHKKTWSSEGALIYPIQFSDNDRHSLSILPSASWKVVSIGQTQTGDIEELQFKVPLAYSRTFTNGWWLRNHELTLAPYFLTDFSFKGAVEGISLTWSPYVLQPLPDSAPNATPLAINTGYKGIGTSPFMYRIGLVPGLDYNHLSSTSRFITRATRPDYLRVGGLAEFGLITQGYPALEMLASYRPLLGVTGAPDYSYLFSLKSKLWLSQYAGLTFEYQKGHTPVAQKEIDLITIGLEVKF